MIRVARGRGQYTGLLIVGSPPLRAPSPARFLAIPLALEPAGAESNKNVYRRIGPSRGPARMTLLWVIGAGVVADDLFEQGRGPVQIVAAELNENNLSVDSITGLRSINPAIRPGPI